MQTDHPPQGIPDGSSRLERFELFAIEPSVPWTALGVAWAIWLWRFAVHLRHVSRPTRGFEVLPAAAPADPPGLADRGR